MNRIAYIFLMLFLIWSCTSRTIYKKPENLIEKEKMIDIWTDIYIANGAKNVKTESLRKNINYNPLILKKHNIDSIQFSASNLYYTSRIEEYERLLTKVNERLLALKDEYQPENKRDSLIKLSKERSLNKN